MFPASLQTSKVVLYAGYSPERDGSNRCAGLKRIDVSRADEHQSAAISPARGRGKATSRDLFRVEHRTGVVRHRRPLGANGRAGRA